MRLTNTDRYQMQTRELRNSSKLCNNNDSKTQITSHISGQRSSMQQISRHHKQNFGEHAAQTARKTTFEGWTMQQQHHHQQQLYYIPSPMVQSNQQQQNLSSVHKHRSYCPMQKHEQQLQQHRYQVLRQDHKISKNRAHFGENAEIYEVNKGFRHSIEVRRSPLYGNNDSLFYLGESNNNGGGTMSAATNIGNGILKRNGRHHSQYYQPVTPLEKSIKFS